MVLIETYSIETVNILYYGHVLEIPEEYSFGTIAIDGDGKCHVYDCEEKGLYYHQDNKQWLMYGYKTKYQPICKFDLEGIDPKETIKPIMEILL